MRNKEKGITLIALIITIIVMLILVGVVVTVVIQSDLLGTANTAGDKYKTAYEEESKMSGVTINGKQYGSIEEYMEEINPTIVEGDPKDWDYTVESDGTITITRYLNEDRTIDTVVVPNYIGGVPVKKITGEVVLYSNGSNNTIWNEKICDGRERIGASDSAPKNITIKKIIISNGIETIEKGAFALTKNLEEIVLPGTLSKLGDYSFQGCTSLERVTIPNSVTEILKMAFYDCTNLTEVRLSDSLTNIGMSAFCSCNLTEITIPSSVTNIGENAFGFCNLTKVTIPNSVISIESGAFGNNKNLTEITIPDSVTTMGIYVFDNIPSITVHVSWKEGKKPEGWANDWNNTESGCTITVDYAK